MFEIRKYYHCQEWDELLQKNILLLKHQKQVAITAALNGQCNQSNIKNSTLVLLPTALRKWWLYQMLPLIVSRDISQIRSKVPDPEFYWSVDQKIDVIAQKRDLFRKTKLYWRIFFQASQNLVGKRKVCHTKVLKQNSAIKCYHEFHARSHKDL